MATEAEKLLEQIREQSPAQRMLAEINAGTAAAPEPDSFLGSVGGGIRGAGEAALTLGTGLVGQVAAGIAGTGRAATGGDLSEVSDIIQRTQEALTFQPRTEEGKQILGVLGEKLQEGVRLVEAGVGGAAELATGQGVSQAAQTIEQIRERGAGDVVLERTGSPLAATAAELGVDLAFLSPALRAAITPARTAGRAQPPPAAAAEPAAPPRVKLTGSEKDVVSALARDTKPQGGSPFRSFQAKRQDQLDALRETRLTAQQTGEGSLIADVGGANTKSLAQVQGAVTREGQFLRDQIVKRDATVRGNMEGILDDTMFKGRSLKQTVDDIDVEMREAADPLYAEAHAQPVSLTPELAAKLKEPAVLDGISEARKLLRIESKLTPVERKAAAAMFEKAKGGGFTINLDNVNMMGLDYLKRGMDELVSKVATKKLKSSEGRNRSIQAAEFRDVLVAQNEAYGKALNVWSTGKKAKDVVVRGRAAFKEIRENTKSPETLVDEFAALPVNEQALSRVGIADYLRTELRRKPNVKNGTTPPSIFESFAGSPAQKQLLDTVFANADDLKKFERLMQREGAFSDTLKAVNIDDARAVNLQQAFEVGELPAVIGSATNDALFAASGNRFAVTNLIQNAFAQPRKFIQRHRAPETARLVLGTEAKTVLDEMIGVLEARQALPGVAKQTAAELKRMRRVAQLPPEKLYKWLKDAKNRRRLYAFGTTAAVVEEAGLEEQQQ